EMDYEPAHLTGPDERGRLDARGGPVGEDERCLRTVDPAVPANGAGISERHGPLDRAVRMGRRIRGLRFERRAIGAERRKIEGRTLESGCGLHRGDLVADGRAHLAGDG